jgi:hypothetical protein
VTIQTTAGAAPVRCFEGWWQVPAGLMSATALRELEYPREPTERPHATVLTEDWAGRRDSLIDLYRAADCPPTTATGAQLAAAAVRSTRARACADCPARCQRPLPVDVGDRPLCPACRSVALMRAAQAKAGADQAAVAARVVEVLARPDAVVVQVDLTVPPPTPAGRRRPPIAARIRACAVASGARLLDVRVSLVGERARLRDEAAVPRDQVAPAVHAALLGRPLICWDHDELLALREAVPHPDWPGGSSPADRRPYSARQDSTLWRAQLDDRRQLVASLAPGSPDRLLLHLQRIAATALDS